VCLPLPEAYRSLPRPSSPPRAKASTVCSYLLDPRCTLVRSQYYAIVKEPSSYYTTVIGFVLPVRKTGCLATLNRVGSAFPRKEVIQPQVPLRLPCYDFTPITPHTLGAYLPRRGWPSDFWYTQLSWCDGRCVQGPGTYSPERADLRLLAIPASGRRVAADHPN
jgi:hypothetical protein